jgi:serine/threonine protein kinase
MADRVGQQLGNYRLTRLLGRGGFAEVYLGEHLRLGTQAAIKILYTHIEDDAVEEFLNETRTVAHLFHPHSVRIFDFDVQEGTPFLVMDYAPNGTLRQHYPKGKPLPLATTVDYVKQVAGALQYAHDEKLIHRDIKPENMLLGRHNELLLSDFGIALVAQSSRLQSRQEVVGTALYMAPEQLRGKPRLASDQYSLGVVVYEWLSGNRPFYGSFSEIASQHMFVPPQPLCEKVPELPRAVEEVVHTALAKEPQQRFASIKAFATALEQACQLVPPRPAALTIKLPTPSEPLPADHTVEATPRDPSSQALNVVTPPAQLLGLTAAAAPPRNNDIGSRSRGPFTPPGVSRLPKHPFSRRIVLIFLAALLAVSGSLGWLLLSHPLFGFALTSVPAAIPTSTLIPAATVALMPSLTAIATLKPSATPTPKAIATPRPTATSTQAAVLGPTPTATPRPTPTPSPTPTTTIHLTQCGNHLVVPWVALYQYSNFGGQQICFSGIGFINLANYGFSGKTQAINIGANGVFFDQSNGTGAQLSFYYGDEQSDLGAWDNRIASFRVSG